VYCKNLLEEFKELDIQAAPANLSLISVKMPKIYAQLKHDAQNSEELADVFMLSPEKIIVSLEHAKKMAMNCLAENEVKHMAYQMAQQLKLAMLIPDGKRVDFLSKYQVQLDTDLYRAIEAFKKHMTWRAENLEIEVGEA